MFAIADPATQLTQQSVFVGSNACIRGTAAKVYLDCTPVAPATDCYATYWGAAIVLNLNQPLDPPMAMAEEILPYDASALQGFSFVISGDVIPTWSSLRFTAVSSSSEEFCSFPAHRIVPGVNTILFDDLISNCWKTDPANRSAETVKSALLRIKWQVVTNTQSTVPYDFCISDIYALRR